MVKYQLGLPSEEFITRKDKFVINELSLLSINKIQNSNNADNYGFLFEATQSMDDSSILLSVIVRATDPLTNVFLTYHPLNMEIMSKDKNKLSEYKERIEGKFVFSADLDMKEYNGNNKNYVSYAARPISDINPNNAHLLELIIPRDIFIKSNVFFKRIGNLDEDAALVFTNHKLNNVEFVNIEHVKLNASTIDNINNIVYSHYTCGVGPTNFRFNFVSPADNKRKLRNPMIANQYQVFYNDDYTIENSIYDEYEDVIYILFEERSDITDKYKSTKALKFTKEMYDKTNFVDPFRIYL